MKYINIPRQNGHTNLPNHAEQQLESGSHVHAFNDEIEARNWVHSVQRRILDERIQNDGSTRFILITGGHGAEDGTSAFTDPDFVDRVFFRQDLNVARRLQGSLGESDPEMRLFTVINMKRKKIRFTSGINLVWLPCTGGHSQRIGSAPLPDRGNQPGRLHGEREGPRRCNQERSSGARGEQDHPGVVSQQLEDWGCHGYLDKTQSLNLCC